MIRRYKREAANKIYHALNRMEADFTESAGAYNGFVILNYDLPKKSVLVYFDAEYDIASAVVTNRKG